MGTSVTVNFDGTPSDAGNGVYTGGFAFSPAAGQLDSDHFSFPAGSVSDGALPFGGTQTTGDFARTSAGAVTVGGIYANTETPAVLSATLQAALTLGGFLPATTTGTRLLFQPSTTDFAPGQLIVRFRNETGGAISQMTVSTDLCARNDAAGSYAVTLEISTDNMTYTPLSTFSTGLFNNPLLPPTGTDLICVNTGPITVPFPAAIAQGELIYFRMTGTPDPSDPASATATEFDEVAIDNIVLASFILPVELTDFTGTATPRGNHLAWTTATELNNDYFNLQRSADGTHWTTLETVLGAGTTETEEHYEFLDRTPPAGLTYYRLEQVDFDGTSTVHHTISVRSTEAEKPVALYPNPVREVLHLRAATPARVRVLDVTGRVVFDQVLPENATLRTADWAPGTYFVSVVTADGAPTTERILKH